MGNACGSDNNKTSLDPETLKFCQENTHFNRKEIKYMHDKFLKESQDGNLTKEQFLSIYRGKLKSDDGGDAENIAGHLFRAFDLDNDSTIGTTTTWNIF